jgi:tRNA(Ile)-lysidine synthase
LVEYCVYELSQLNSSLAPAYVNEISRFLEQGHVGSEFSVTDQVMLIKNRNNAVFTLTKELEKIEHNLNPEHEITIGRNKLRLQEVQSKDFKLSENSNVEFVCGDRLVFPLKVRSWKKGDYFYPLGMKSRQKISDFFVNYKIEKQKKNCIPIVENNGDIIWLAGWRLDNRYKVEKNCKRIFKIEWITG